MRCSHPPFRTGLSDFTRMQHANTPSAVVPHQSPLEQMGQGRFFVTRTQTEGIAVCATAPFLLRLGTCVSENCLRLLTGSAITGAKCCTKSGKNFGRNVCNILPQGGRFTVKDGY